MCVYLTGFAFFCPMLKRDTFNLLPSNNEHRFRFKERLKHLINTCVMILHKVTSAPGSCCQKVKRRLYYKQYVT